MDPAAQVAAISGAVALTLGILEARRRKSRPGLAAEAIEHADPQVVVQKIAQQGIDGMTPNQVAAAVSVLAQALTSVTARVNVLERREMVYQRRLAVVEHIAVYSTDPPPRVLPPWPDEPSLES